MMSIWIIHSKTDQHRQGNRVVVARTGTPVCPVAMLEQYLLRTGMPQIDKIFLFWPIQRTKKGEALRVTEKISYSCLKRAFHQKPAESFGLHSLRGDGATAAANAKMPDTIGSLSDMADGPPKMPRMVM